jgi:hypothetical protein
MRLGWAAVLSPTWAVEDSVRPISCLKDEVFHIGINYVSIQTLAIAKAF